MLEIFDLFFFFFFQVLKKYSESNFFVFKIIVYLFLFFLFIYCQAFFNEERGELAKKRQKIRLVQQRKVIDMTSLCRDLPDLIPMPLVIGTKVTARLRHPQVSFSIGYPILFGLVMIFLYILP